MEYVEPNLVASVAMYKGQGCEKKDPSKAVLALEMMAEGKGYDEVGVASGLTFEQLSGLRGRHKMALELRRAQLAEDGFEMAEGLRMLAKKKMAMLADNEDALAKVSLKDLVLPYAIAQDKAFAALGENKSVVEHRIVKTSLEDAKAAIEAARAEVRAELMKEAIVVEEIK